MTSHDFTDPDVQPFGVLVDLLLKIKADLPIVDDKLIRARAEFDRIWKHAPIQRGGHTVADAEDRMLWIAMEDAGYEKHIDCVDEGWNMSYGNGKTVFVPFNGLAEDYEAAISAIEADHD